MPGMSEETRRAAAETRRLQSRRLILEAAAAFVGEGKVSSVTMKALAQRATVSVNTIKRQFPSLDHVFAEISESRQLTSGETVNGKFAAQFDDGRDREFISDTLRELKRLEDYSYSNAVAGTESLYRDLLDKHPREHYLLGATCCYRSYRYLNDPGDDESRIASGKAALRSAQDGLRHLAEGNGRHYALSGQLARNAAAAAHSLSVLACSGLGEDPDEVDFLRAKLTVFNSLSDVEKYKQIEKSFADKLGRRELAVAAEFHRARAEALRGEDVSAELDAVIAMARALVRLSDSAEVLSTNTLVPFLCRLCAVQMAYARQIESRTDAQDFPSLRDRLYKVLASHHGSATPARALATMFELVDRSHLTQLDHPKGLLDNEVQQTPGLAALILVASYGIVGKLLVADFLLDVAEASVAGNNPFPSTKLFSVGLEDLLGAARMYYEQAPKNTLIVGAAHQLAIRARQSVGSVGQLARKAGLDVVEPSRWPIFEENGTLNRGLVDQLALGIASGKPPTRDEAQAMLNELKPMLLTLRSIAGDPINPEENGASESLVVNGFRFY